MTTALEATDKDFEQMMQMLTGFFVTQIASAVATYSIADPRFGTRLIENKSSPKTTLDENETRLFENLVDACKNKRYMINFLDESRGGQD